MGQKQTNKLYEVQKLYLFHDGTIYAVLGSIPACLARETGIRFPAGERLSTFNWTFKV